MPKFQTNNIVEVINPIHKWFNVYVEVLHADDTKEIVVASPIGIKPEPIPYKDVQFIAKDFDSVPEPEWT